MKQRVDKSRRARRKQRRAAIEDLERVHETDFHVRRTGPRPAERKPRQSKRRPFTVPADERAILALQPDGTDQKRKVLGIPYLFVRVTPGGKRTFCAMKRMSAQRTALRALGEVGRMTLREAVLGCQVAIARWRIMELEAELQAARGGADA